MAWCKYEKTCLNNIIINIIIFPLFYTHYGITFYVHRYSYIGSMFRCYFVHDCFVMIPYHSIANTGIIINIRIDQLAVYIRGLNISCMRALFESIICKSVKKYKINAMYNQYWQRVEDEYLLLRSAITCACHSPLSIDQQFTIYI